MGVGGYGGDEGWIRRAEGCAIGAIADWQGLDGVIACWRPLLQVGLELAIGVYKRGWASVPSGQMAGGEV